LQGKHLTRQLVFAYCVMHYFLFRELRQTFRIAQIVYVLYDKTHKLGLITWKLIILYYIIFPFLPSEHIILQATGIIHVPVVHRSRDSSVSIVTRLQAG